MGPVLGRGISVYVAGRGFAAGAIGWSAFNARLGAAI
jgi:hypothetical protein